MVPGCLRGKARSVCFDNGHLHRRRPREGEDPYAVRLRLCTAVDTRKIRWLWVPAFAGTIATTAPAFISAAGSRFLTIAISDRSAHACARPLLAAR
jgi:hypothetical protein